MAVYGAPTEHIHLDTPIADRHHLRIINNLLASFQLSRGDIVVEVGAGSGRYTQLLLSAGLKVTAIEPDKVLAEKMTQSLSGATGLTVVNDFPGNLHYYPDNIKAVCGFHVLHHIRGSELEDLYGFLGNLMLSRPTMNSWFFLEPNPFSPLWILEILVQHGQKFREERGIWQQYMRGRFDTASDVRAGCGWLPPRPWVERLGKYADLGTALTPRRMPWNVYQIVGAVRRHRDDAGAVAGPMEAVAGV